MKKTGDFIQFETSNGIRVWVDETTKYKTTLIDVFLRHDLDEDATRIALIPPLLKRGSQAYPSLTAIEERSEELYGAHLGADVEKAGENHLISLRLSLPNGKFIPDEPPLLREGMAFLAEVMLHPALEDGGFQSGALEQEKENLKNFVEGLINDKVSYADEMLIRNMCEGERFALYEYGRVEDLPGINGQDLYAYYQSLLAGCPIDIYVAGEVTAEEVRALVEEMFAFERNGSVPIEPTQTDVVPTQVKTVKEEHDVVQGKLCVGYRTFITLADEDYYPLVWLNGILGGFLHSKLFKNVREKHSLAYYASSSFEKLKGLLIIHSGIEAENYDKAVEVIQEQVTAIQAGDLSEEELSNTLAGLTNRIKSVQDAPGQKIHFLMQQNLGGRSDSLEEVLQKLSVVTKEQIVQVAQKLALDTIFFLAPSKSK